MSVASVKALLVFCEGPHDVAFVKMVMRKCMNFKKVETSFKNLPAPFNTLFKQAVATHVAKDLSLDMSHKFFLPDCILRKEDQLIFLFNGGGKTQYDKVKTLLSDYLPMFLTARTFAQGASEIVDSVRYLFLYDADDEGLDAVLRNVTTEFSRIGDIDFLTENWLEPSISTFGKMVSDKGVFVWGETPNQGTLEDILLPMFVFADTDLIAKAEAAIGEMFTWDINHSSPKIAVPEVGKKQKAILTLSGQREKPGSSMTVILEQSGLITKDALNNNAITQEFISFVETFMALSA